MIYINSFFNEKIEKIKIRGLNTVHVVSDFDRTLTKCFFDGKKIPSSIALIREGGYLSKDYAGKAFALFDKYNVFEMDNSLDFNFKFDKMKEWWETHEKLLINSGMHEKVIFDILKKYPKVFREGVFDFLDFLKLHNVPLLIFSSGIGNLIEGYLKNNNRLSSNIHILSNIFNFDSDGFALGYKNEIIHLMNKSEDKIGEKYKNLIKHKRNVILLGDSLEDINMVTDFDIIIKIGFLNENVDKNLALYRKNFDVVITDDGSMDFVNELLYEFVK